MRYNNMPDKFLQHNIYASGQQRLNLPGGTNYILPQILFSEIEQA